MATQLIISAKLKYCEMDEIDGLLDCLDENQKMIYNLIKSLK